MKKIFLFTAVAIAALSACQQAPKAVTADIEAEKSVIDSLFDVFYTAFSKQDVATLSSFLAEDALCMGTDPSEFFNKQQFTDMWTQMLSGGAPELTFVSERKVLVAADGRSATVVDQYLMPSYFKIPWRNAYHLAKTDAGWKILVINVAFIPRNEDLPKLDAAIE